MNIKILKRSFTCSALKLTILLYKNQSSEMCGNNLLLKLPKQQNSVFLFHYFYFARLGGTFVTLAINRLSVRHHEASFLAILVPKYRL